ncbi:hypothetical protein ACLB2K_073773 [Fragaria x ananassa]
MSKMMSRYENSVGRIRNRGLYDDYLSDQFSPVLKSHLLVLEEEIGKIFTHDIYLIIRDQIMFESKFLVAGRAVNDRSSGSVVTITQYGKQQRKWIVVNQPDIVNPTFSCSCKLFESDGIPCCHIFALMKAENVTKFPTSLVSRRWTKEGLVTVESETRVDGKFVQLASVEGYDGVKEVLSRLTIESCNLPQPTNIDPKDVEHGIDSSTGMYRNVIKDPVPCRSRGRKRNNGSGKGSKKRPNYGKCKQYGHNKRSFQTKGTKGKGNVSSKSDTDDMGQQSSTIEGDSSMGESNYSSGSSDVDMGDEETLKKCVGKLFHHMEEARTFVFISGEDNIGAPSTSSSGGGGDYFRHFIPFRGSA